MAIEFKESSIKEYELKEYELKDHILELQLGDILFYERDTSISFLRLFTKFPGFTSTINTLIDIWHDPKLKSIKYDNNKYYINGYMAERYIKVCNIFSLIKEIILNQKRNYLTNNDIILMNNSLSIQPTILKLGYNHALSGINILTGERYILSHKKIHSNKIKNGFILEPEVKYQYLISLNDVFESYTKGDLKGDLN